MDEIETQREGDENEEAGEPCPRCERVLISLVRCQYCGNRLEDSHSLTPYQRLGLKPKALYLQSEIDAASDTLLAQLHVLRSSRLLASWSLKQRALVRRDATLLSRLSGALQAYLRERVRRGLQSTSQNMAYEPRSRECLEAAIPSPARTLLLRHAMDELIDLDGYQERERLLNRISRELRQESVMIARQLISIDLDHASLPQISTEISHLAEAEDWLDAQRFDTAQSRRS